jgi:O-Antigen ligase
MSATPASPPRLRTWVGLAACGSLVAAVGSVLAPIPTLSALAAFFALALGVALRRRLPQIFLASLGVVLIGYAFLGKGFAYLGTGSFYVGELVLALGLVAALVCYQDVLAVRSPTVWVLVAFCAWGALRTAPYLSTYGLDALRDATLWAYGLFAILVAAFLARTNWLRRLPERYIVWASWFVLWVPIGTIILSVAGNALPRFPLTDTVIFGLKPGDASVHLAGIAAFLLVGLHEVMSGQERPVAGASAAPRQRGGLLQEWMWWLGWLVGFFLTGAQNRGGLLSMLTACLIAGVFGGSTRWVKPLVAFTLISLVLVSSDAGLSLGGSRLVSPQQLVDNVTSLTGGSTRQDLVGSREWRLAWWGTIVDYTVLGNYFFGGKGFGVNLAVDDGFDVTTDQSLRSPHNVHMSVLARSGVVGLLIWVLLQTSFFISLLRTYLLARRARDVWWARMSIWILAYWSAFVVNASFDVYLEGPQGGIWFWSVFGAGIALVLSYRRLQAPGFAGVVHAPRSVRQGFAPPQRRQAESGVR